MSTHAPLTHQTITDTYTAMRESVRTGEDSNLTDDQIRSLAEALTTDIVDISALDDDEFVQPAHMTHADIGRLLNAARRILSDVVTDRATLMEARAWERDAEATHHQPLPTSAETEALLTALRDGTVDTGQLDREQLLAHVTWFHGIRNFVVHEKRDAQQARQYAYGQFAGVEAAMALGAVHQLIEAASAGAEPTVDDLVWATQGLQRLREPWEPGSDNTAPPCLRASRTSEETQQ